MREREFKWEYTWGIQVGVTVGVQLGVQVGGVCLCGHEQEQGWVPLPRAALGWSGAPHPPIEIATATKGLRRSKEIRR